MTKITFMRASYGSLESLLNYLKGSLIKDPFFTADKTTLCKLALYIIYLIIKQNILRIGQKQLFFF